MAFEIEHGSKTVEDVLELGARGNTDEVGHHARVAGRMKVVRVILAVDGIGPIKAKRILASAGLVGDERLDTLSAEKRLAVVTAVEVEHPSAA